MHIATWRQEVNDATELARRATYAATEAAGQIPCLKCGHPAVVYVRVQAMRFAAECCDTCAAERMEYAAIARATVELDKLVGVDLPMMVDGIDGSIDVAQLVRDVLDCAVGDHDVRAVQSVPGGVAAALLVLAGKMRRAITPSEQAAVVAATRVEFLRRLKEKRAALRETQSRLASPFSVFGQRAI